MKKYFLIFLLFFFALPIAKASACDIQPIARSYLNEVYNYANFGLKKPRLIITNDPLIKLSEEDKKQFGKNINKTRGLLASYTDLNKNEIVVYSKIFEDHSRCDGFVANKLKRLIVHEYTHYIDGNKDFYLSGLVGTENLEKTAIIGEHIFPKLVWGKKNTRVIRPLTKDEIKKAKMIRAFILSYHNQSS
jgi:hypothetical protein